jgi:hypothetical protein
MIICQNLNDVGTWPAGAVDYHRRVVKLRGEEAADRDFRVYFFDHAAHVPGSMFPSAGRPHASTRLIDYAGALQQALVDMIKWVEEDTAPPARSVYDYTDDCALVLAPTAAERHGTQPVPVLTIEGGPAARVATGSTVTLDLAAEVPPGAGPIVSVEWDVTGDGDWQPEPGIDGTSSSCSLTHEHTYTEPGVYWPSVRVTSQRDGDVDAALCLVPALAQTRLDVSG